MADYSILIASFTMNSTWDAAQRKWKTVTHQPIPVQFDVPQGARIDKVTLEYQPHGNGGILVINGQSETIGPGDIDTIKTVQLTNVATQNVVFEFTHNGIHTTVDSRALDIRKIKATIYYDTAVAPGPVTSAQLAKTAALAGQFVQLKWNHVTATPPVRKYIVHYSDKPTDGIEYTNWTLLQEISDNQTYVPAPAQGYTRRFRIAAVSMDSTGNLLQSDWYQVNSTLTAVKQGETPSDEQQPVNTMMPYRVVHIWRRVR